MPNDTTQLTSVVRTFRILEFIRDNEPVTLTAIADEVSLPKSTVHRYISTMLAREYIVRDGDEYRISFKLLEFANPIRTREPAYTVIREKIRELSHETGELVQFMAEENDKAVYLFEDAGEQGIGVGSYARTFRPLYSTASGKAILSTWETDEIHAYIDRTDLNQLTKKTITDSSGLVEELERVRDRGYATNYQETVEGLSAVAVPVARPSGQAAGALTISGPANRISTDSANKYVPLLLDAKNEVELNLSLL